MSHTKSKSAHISSTSSDLQQRIRTVKLSSGGKWRLALPICALFASFVIGRFVIVGQLTHMSELVKNGRLANGILISKQRDTVYPWMFDLNVTYSVNSHVYSGTGHVTGNVFAAAIPGETKIPVTYLPSNPNDFEIGPVSYAMINDQLRSDLYWIAFISTLLVFWLGIVLIMTISDLGFARRCITTQGRITDNFYKSSVGIRPGSSGTLGTPPQITFTIKYEFRVGKHMISSSANVDQAFYYANEKGEAITVYYDPRKPTWCRIEPEMRMVVRSQ